MERATGEALAECRPALNNFDFLRFLLAAIVVLGHSFVLYSKDAVNYAHEPLFLLTKGQESLGHLAVSCFFTISGFLITQSFLRSTSLFGYLKKRVLRIYPAFVVVTLLGMLVVVPLSTGAFPDLTNWRMAGYAVLSCLLLRRVESAATIPGLGFPKAFAHNPLPNAVNGSLWTIPYEFYCYVIVAALGVMVLRRHRRAGTFVIAALFAVAYWASVRWVAGPHPLLWPERIRERAEKVLLLLQHWPNFLAFFLGGALFYLWRERIRFSLVASGVTVAVLAVAARYPDGLSAWLPAALRYHYWLILLEPALVPYVLLSVAFSKKIPLHGFARYGDFSYGMYLYAFPIQQLLVQFLHPGPLVLFLIALPGAVICGALSWHGVEKWFLRLKRGDAKPSCTTADVERGVLQSNGS